jgi:Fe2+ transport system protein FeoA
MAIVRHITDVPEAENCKNCTPCLRLRLLELGFLPGEDIEIVSHKLGLWVVNMLSEKGDVVSTIALREEEFDRICLL